MEWNAETHYRWAEVTPGLFGSDGFRQLSASRTGIDFQNVITEEEIAENRHYLNGSGVAAGDINGNGLTDLYFTGLSNANRLKIFENNTGQPGIRVTLQGPPSNRNGVGSGVQLDYGDEETGPLRRIQSGSGYWSQNSFTQVLGIGSNDPAAIRVSWFDGTYQSVPVEAGKIDYLIIHPDYE